MLSPFIDLSFWMVMTGWILVLVGGEGCTHSPKVLSSLIIVGRMAVQALITISTQKKGY